jgi:hypothetical protein
VGGFGGRIASPKIGKRDLALEKMSDVDSSDPKRLLQLHLARLESEPVLPNESLTVRLLACFHRGQIVANCLPLAPSSR